MFLNPIPFRAAIPALLLFTLACPTRIATAAEGALTNWQSAYLYFQKAGDLIASKEFDRAQNHLSAGATNLPPGYQAVAKRALSRLEAVFNRKVANDAVRLDRLADVCMSLHAYPQAASLKAAAHPKEAGKPNQEEEPEDELLGWRLFELGKFDEAIAEYKRKVADADVRVFREYYQKQIDLIQRRPANLTNVNFALEFVRDRYLSGFEAPGDHFCALKELHRVLPFVRQPAEGLAVYRMIIQLLSGLNDEAGRHAWEDRLMLDFKSDADSSAEVYLTRGNRAFAEKRFQDALELFLKVCKEFPDSDVYGDAQYNAGSTLQEQGKYDAAIQEYLKIFPSKANEYKLIPGTSEDYKLYRHKSALRISECYESKKDYARALEYAEMARTQYKPLSWCGTCLKTEKQALDARITRLEGLFSASP